MKIKKTEKNKKIKMKLKMIMIIMKYKKVIREREINLIRKIRIKKENMKTKDYELKIGTKNEKDE